MLGVQRRSNRSMYHVDLSDDMLIVGTTEAVNEAIQILQQSFEVKAPTTLEDYLGVQVIKSKNLNSVTKTNPNNSKELLDSYFGPLDWGDLTLLSMSCPCLGSDNNPELDTM